MTKNEKWTDEEKWALRIDLYATVSEKEYDEDCQEEQEKEKRIKEKREKMTPEEIKRERDQLSDLIHRACVRAKKDLKKRNEEMATGTIKKDCDDYGDDDVDDDEHLGVGDEVQFTEEIRQYKGHDIVPQPDWILTEGLSFRVEELFSGSTVYPSKHYLESNDPRPSPPFTLLSVPRVYVSLVDKSNFKYMLAYDYINTEGTLIQSDEPPEERLILNSLGDEDLVKIDGIDYMVWTDDILVPTHWLKRTKTWDEALRE